MGEIREQIGKPVFALESEAQAPLVTELEP